MQGSDNGFVKVLQYDEQDEVVNPNLTRILIMKK